MKKPKPSLDMDDQELDSPSPLDLGRMDDDDEIIDLEDVIELPDFDDHLDEGGLGGDDVEILDAESGLVVKGIDLRADRREVDLLADDFLKGFTAQQDKSPPCEPAEEKDPFSSELEDDILKELSLFDKSFSEGGADEQGLREEKDESDILPPGKDSAGAKAKNDSPDLDLDSLIAAEKASALESGDEKDLADILAIEKSFKNDAPLDDLLLDAMKLTEGDITPLAAAAAPLQAHALAQAETQRADSTLEAVVEGIESRLLQAVRDMVEARLPELVRTLLREEIDRLREELKD